MIGTQGDNPHWCHHRTQWTAETEAGEEGDLRLTEDGSVLLELM